MAHIEDRWKSGDKGRLRWCVRYRDPAGAQRRRSFRRRVDAERFLTSIEADRLRGTWIDQAIAQTSVGKMAERWYDTTADLRPTTRKDYRFLLDKQVLPEFGRVAVGAVDALAVRGWLARLGQQGLSASRRRHAFYVLSAILDAAVQANGLARNPLAQNAAERKSIPMPYGRRHEMCFLSAAQVEQLAEAITAPYGTLIRFAAYTGLRAGEIGALRVRHLDLLHGMVRVVESTADVGGHLITGPTKTKVERTVRLPRFLRDELSVYLAGRRAHPDAYVFTAQGEGQLRHNNFYQRHYKPAVRRAGLPERLRFHDLRHTCASLLIAQGAHPRAIMEHLGHSSISITMDRYGHVFPDQMEALANQLDAARFEALDEPLAAPLRPRSGERPARGSIVGGGGA